MKKIFYLLVALFMISTLSAQNKKLTLYYPDSTRIVNISGLDSMTIFICGASKVSYGGKDYNTVLIGDQCWLKENLDIGTMVNGGSNQGNNSIIEKYCYNNDPANCTVYGGLYLWDEAMQYVTTEGARGICPEGWHMPKESEYQTLVDFVSNDANALKRNDQGTGAGQGTNSSGFSALLGGGKAYDGGYFVALGEWGSYYVGKDGSCGYDCVYTLRVDNNTSTIYFGQGTMPSWGVSVRCIKNN